jgi:glyoxylase I family protein
MPPSLTGYHHVSLTVRDAERSAAWYIRVLGFEHVGLIRGATFHRVVLRHSDGLLMTLLTHDDGPGDAFDERRTGLDHFAFAVADSDAVDGWAAHLASCGVEFSGPQAGGLPGSRLIVFRDPDGVQLECYCSAQGPPPVETT